MYNIQQNIQLQVHNLIRYTVYYLHLHVITDALQITKIFKG
jgi:hypothetical protein